MVVSIVYNWNKRYSNHNNNIKYIDSTIKCINFELFHYIINLYLVSSFEVFSNFDYMFISMYCLFESIKKNLFSKNIKINYINILYLKINNFF